MGMINLKDTVNRKLMPLALAAALPFGATQADTKADAQAVMNQLNASLANAELSIALAEAEYAIGEVQAQEAINMLAASIAEADLSITLASANDAIRQVQGQEAINSLLASVANAEVSLALVDASMAVASVSDETMLQELDSVLDDVGSDEANALIMAVVSERPMLAAAVQDMALSAGYNEAMVATAVVSGLGSAAATAAGR